MRVVNYLNRTSKIAHLGFKKPKNIIIEGGTENKFLSFMIRPKTFFEKYCNPKNSPLGP